MIRLATLLTILLCFHSARAQGHDGGRACEWALVADPELSGLVDLALSNIFDPDAKRANPVLYQNLVLAIAHDLTPQPEAVRVGVLVALHRAQATLKGFVLEQTWARVDEITNGHLAVFYSKLLDPSFALMFYIGHEAVHLVRDYEYVESEPNVIEAHRKPFGRLGTYLSERRAITRGYDLAFASFGARDLPRLKQDYLEPFRELMSRPAEEMSSREDAARFYRLLANLKAYMGVQERQTTSNRALVTRELQNYRGHHAQAQAARFLQTAVNPLRPPSDEEAKDLLARVTRANQDVHRARYPHKHLKTPTEDEDL